MSVSSSSTQRLILLAIAAAGLGALFTILVQRAWLDSSAPRQIANASSIENPITKLAAPKSTSLQNRSATFVGRPGPVPDAPDGEIGVAKESRLKLDQRFRAERFDPVWASAQEEAVLNAIAGTEHDGFDVPLPQSIDTRCRSSICRIRMTYSEEDNAAEMQAKIMLGMPRTLSVARTFYDPINSGGTEVVIYAGQASALR